MSDCPCVASSTRSTQRAQTSLAEADHYSHIAHYQKLLSRGGERLHPTPHPSSNNNKKVLDHYLHHDLGMPPYYRIFFSHLLILEYPNHHQTLISSSLYYPGPRPKISSQSVHNFLSNVIHKQTDKPTPPKNITSFAKEVMKVHLFLGL